MKQPGAHASAWSLYIHIPFCKQKCGYCDFYSLATEPGHPIFEQFTQAVIQEIKLQIPANQPNRPVRTIYIGGGTPSLLDSQQMAKIFQTISTRFDLSELKEATLEVNPGTIDLEKLELYRQLGINRLSIGVQAFQNHLLKRLERIHSADQAVQAIEMGYNAGFVNLNLDLIFGIPGQTLHDWQESLTQALALKTEHLSIYNLIYEEGTPFYRNRQAGKIQPLTEEIEEEFYFFTRSRLEAAGYQHYEISNYSRPGKECLHNLGYWNYQPYLGFGPAAHSFDSRTRRWNLSDLHGYLKSIEAGNLPPAEQEILTAEMQLEEWLFLQMRQSKGIRLERMQMQDGRPSFFWSDKLKERFGNEWRELFNYNEEQIAFTAKGFWLSDEILPILLEMLQTAGVESPPPTFLNIEAET